jgi:hypothetical protein
LPKALVDAEANNQFFGVKSDMFAENGEKPPKVNRELLEFKLSAHYTCGIATGVMS